MAEICGNCGSSDTAAGLDSYQCFDCGRSTTYKGEPREPGLRYTSEVAPGPLGDALATVRAAEDQGVDVAAVVANEIDSAVPNTNDLAVLAIENASEGGSPKTVYDTASTLQEAERAKAVAKAAGGTYPASGPAELPDDAVEDQKSSKK